MFRLALALGMTVGELSNRMSSHELQEWIAYSLIEPFGEWRADLRAGIVASTIANVNRGKGRRAYKATDFMPFERPQRKAQTPEEMKAVAHRVAAFVNRSNTHGHTQSR